MFNSNISPEFIKNNINQYEVISQLKGGQKLMIKSSDQSLEISHGSTGSSFGRVFQGFSRVVGALTNVYQSDWESVASKIDHLNENMKDIIDYYKNHPAEISNSNLTALKEKLAAASKGLREMGDLSYGEKEQAREKFKAQSEAIQSLSNQVLLFDLPEEVGEEEWDLLRVEESIEKEDIEADFEQITSTHFAALSSKALSFLEEEEASSSELNEDFIVVKDSTETILETLHSFKSPLIEVDLGMQFAVSLQKEFGALHLDSEALHSQILMINSTLSELQTLENSPDFRKMQKIITEIVVFALFPPLLKDGTSLTLFNQSKLLTLLKDPALINKISLNYFENPTIYQKILMFSHLNFSNEAILRELREERLFNAIANSPSLPLFLLGNRTHSPQVYRQTCIGTAHNLYFQRHCGTLAELLMLSKKTKEEIENRLSLMSEGERKAPAYEVNSGIAPSKEDFVRNVLKKTEMGLQEIEKAAFQLATKENCSSKEIVDLVQKWNFRMQDLETIYNPKAPRIYNEQYLPHYYYLSAALSEISNQLEKIFPNSPLNQARWKSLNKEDMQELGEKCLGSLSREPIYGHEYSEVDAPLFQEISGEKIWKRVRENNGCLLDFLDFGGRQASSGHTILVTAEFDGEKKFFVLYDPMKSKEEKKELKDFMAFLHSHKKTEGNRISTHQMYGYRE